MNPDFIKAKIVAATCGALYWASTTGHTFTEHAFKRYLDKMRKNELATTHWTTTPRCAAIRISEDGVGDRGVGRQRRHGAGALRRDTA